MYKEELNFLNEADALYSIVNIKVEREKLEKQFASLFSYWKGGWKL